MSGIWGEKLNFDQENGPDVTLTVYGDEFYARYENEDGYTVVHDKRIGLYCYANLTPRGDFVSSGVPISDKPPERLQRHIRESEAARGKKFETRHTLRMPKRPPFAPGLTDLTFGPDRGLLTGRKIHEGKITGLTILVDFQDLEANFSVAEVSALLNEPGYSGNANFCSVRDYFLRMSGGRLDYSNRVYGPIKLREKRSYYMYYEGQENPVVREAMLALEKRGVDLSEFDSSGDGIIDAINVMYAGPTKYEGWLWPHNFVLDMTVGGLKTEFYMICSSAGASIGTFCHENGHMLCRFPDLYDYGGRDGDATDSSGLGYYCLMSYGNHSNQGRTPAPICAYLRGLAGWTNEVSVNTKGKFEAVQGDYGKVFKFDLGEHRPNEYFLIENRHAVGLDQYLPSSGLAVYHCDTEGSNELQEGTPAKHYQCALLQADGRNDLERNVNGGDPADLFAEVGGRALAYETNPSTRKWDRSDSGMAIENISVDGAKITFEIK